MALIICPKCGKENKDGNRFCSSCGAMLDVMSDGTVHSGQRNTTKADDLQSANDPVKLGFFRKPAGRVLIIAIVVAIVVILLVVLMWRHSRQTSEQVDQEPLKTEEETAIEDIETAQEDTEDVTIQANPAGDYILSDSDQRYYTESELSGLSDNQLRLARNEIYARHGRIFDSSDLRDYFESQSWYNGTIEPADFSDNVLNEYEQANIKLIQSLEDTSVSSSEVAVATNSIITTVPSGQIYSCDLNGDGITETVSVKDDNDKTEVQLLINGENCASINWAWSGVCYIVDVDTSDDTLQIGVQYSTDDDYTGTVFYSYDSGGIHLLDYISGTFFGPGPFPNITCAGDGMIQSYKALGVFETWFTSATWMFKDGQLVELVPSVYEPLDLFDGRGIDLTVLQSIVVTKGEPYFGERVTLPVGTKIHMTGTDNYDWVSMTADGIDGTLYLQLYDGFQVFLAGSNEKAFIATVFDNLTSWA